MGPDGNNDIDDTVLAGGAVLTTVRGAQPGPAVALLGGVHGDEDEGVLAVCRILHELRSAPLTGTVRAVARANPPAWAAVSRVSPVDGGNLARSFPGHPDGDPTERLAASITREVIEGADLLIDLHSAGRALSCALFCGYMSVGDDDVDKRAEAAAIAFGTPFIWEHREYAPGRSLSAAADRGIPAIYAEAGGNGAIRARELDVYVRGVLAVMAELGMLPASYRWDPPSSQQRLLGSGDIDKGAQSEHHGFFVPAIEAGDAVGTGDEIGRIYSFDGAILDTVVAGHTGLVVFLRHHARVHPGDMLFVMADRADVAL